MSRSKKKNKIRGITIAESEKQNKRDANRKFRRIVNQKVKTGDEVLPRIREVSDTWNFNKDGKTYEPDINEKYMRK